MVVQCVVLFAGSAILAGILTWAVRSFARRRGLAMATPSSHHIHSRPIPRVGGVALFVTFAVVFIAHLLLTQHGLKAGPPDSVVTTIFLIAIPFFAAGLVDDLRTLGPWAKLLLQVGGGTALYFSGIYFGFCSHLFHPPIGQAVCLGANILWVVLICNAINLLDGIDGLAAGAALFSMVTIFTFAVGCRSGLATATVILAGSLVGFLVFNFNPASIFLGDCGSLFVGFMLSGFVLAESVGQQRLLGRIFVPLVCFALPLTEVAISVVRRFLSGHALFGADREHIHHKLLELGLTQRQAVGVLYGVSALCALLSLSLLSTSDKMLIPVAGILLLVLFFGIRKLGYREFGEFGRVGKRVVQQKQVFARNIAVRRAAAFLESSRDIRQVVQILEECLSEDFDGFEIVLDEDFPGAASLASPWYQGAVSYCWRRSQEEICVSMGLYSEGMQTIGKISLYQSADSSLLIDTDLLKRTFRKSLTKAVQNATHPALRIATPEIKRSYPRALPAEEAHELASSGS